MRLKMNQILSVETNKEKKKKEPKMKKSRGSGPADIKSVLKFFSITMVIFGIFLIGTGSYSMYKDSQEKNTITKPQIVVEKTSEDMLVLKVTHDKALSELNYSWNEGEKIPINVNGRKNIEQAIELPTGSNTLDVYAKDINGQEITFKNMYNRESSITLNIDKEENGNDIVISASGKEQLSYLTYRWDDQEETKVDINNTKIEHTIEAIKGVHVLTVVVVDINNNTETKEMNIIGTKKPTLDIDVVDGNFVIKGSDESGLDVVRFIINETDKKQVVLDGRTEFEIKYPISEGETRLDVTLYNKDGISENRKVKARK